MAVDDNLSDVGQELGSPVLAGGELKEGRRLVNETSREAAGEEVGVGYQVEQERNVRFHAADAKFLQAALHAAGGVKKAQAVRRHLDQQGIIERRDHGARKRRAGIEADAHAAGRAVMAEPAVIRHEVVARILGRHAALKGEAVRAHVVLRRQANVWIGEGPSLGDQDLALDDVHAGDLLGDGVLDLDARIDFDEVEEAGIGIKEEFDGAGVVQVHGVADGEGSVEDALAGGGFEIMGRRHFDDFLMAALQGAIALVQVNQMAVVIAKKLHLDVPGVLDKLFQKDVGDAEGRSGFALGLLDRFFELLGAASDAHAAAAAAHGRLDDHGIAELAGQALVLGQPFQGGRAAGQNRHARLLCNRARRYLVTQLLEDFGPRAHENESRLPASTGELRILR